MKNAQAIFADLAWGFAFEPSRLRSNEFLTGTEKFNNSVAFGAARLNST